MSDEMIKWYIQDELIAYGLITMDDVAKRAEAEKKVFVEERVAQLTTEIEGLTEAKAETKGRKVHAPDEQAVDEKKPVTHASHGAAVSDTRTATEKK